MSEEWLSIYGKYSDAELVAEIATLKTASQNLLTSQQIGSRAYTKSNAEIRDRLQAALEVQQRRGVADNVSAQGPLFPDFSAVQV